VLALLLAVFVGRELLTIDDTVPDFVATLTGVEMVADGAGADLYDLDLQAEYQADIDSRMTDFGALLPFVNPAFYLVPFLPLAGAGPDVARGIVIVITAAFTVWWAVFAHRRLPPTGLALAVFVPAALLFQPLLENTFQPQNGVFSLWFLTLGYVSLADGRDRTAGLWLGLLVFKPQLALPFLLLILVKRRWGAVQGAMVSGIAAALVSIGLTGFSGARDYVELILGDELDAPNRGVAVEAMQNWRAFFRVAVGDGTAATALTVLVSLLLVGLLVVVWRGDWDVRHPRFSLQWASTVAVALSISPHLHRHDLTVLLLTMVLLLGARNTYDWPSGALAAAGIAAGYVLAIGADNATDRLSIVIMPSYMTTLAVVAAWMLRASQHHSRAPVDGDVASYRDDS